jgi:effector-binding domain-containing protein
MPLRETMIHDVDIRPVPEQFVAVARGPGATADIWPRIRAVQRAIGDAGLAVAGPPMARFWDWDAGLGRGDFDAAIPLAPAPDGSAPDAVAEYRVDFIPHHHALTATLQGPLSGIATVYLALDEAAGALGYTLAGPRSEVYVIGPDEVDDQQEYVTEVRFPYAR